MRNFQLEDIKTKTLKDMIYKNLKDVILSNNFPSEEYVTEQNLADQLDVSRTPLREAMMDLVNEELIEFKPRKGYKVRKYSNNEIDQIFLLRKVIESEIIEPLLQNFTPEKSEMLKDITLRQEKCMETEDGYAFMNLDKEFHRQMFLISGYNIFLKSYDVFHNLTILIGSQVIQKKGRKKEVIQEHNDIIEGLEKGEKQLVLHAITHHLERTKDMYTDVQTKNK
ncbi:GntR family transcriptional regulator [Lentibacillus sp. N15]|uniref:GntR family transcriptional regulator n=1 Tax=Lentibacillus songyuanensis TaxID=3136161 RepID=UPI0031BA8A35